MLAICPRAFAAQQKANPLTVAKAYQLFQDTGLVDVKRGVGLFVGKGRSRQIARAGTPAFPE